MSPKARPVSFDCLCCLLALLVSVVCLLFLLSVLVFLACVFIAWLPRLLCELALLTCFRVLAFHVCFFVRLYVEVMELSVQV